MLVLGHQSDYAQQHPRHARGQEHDRNPQAAKPLVRSHLARRCERIARLAVLMRL